MAMAMASRIVRAPHAVCRSWSSGLAGISRGFGELWTSVQSRSYSDERLGDSIQAALADTVEESNDHPQDHGSIKAPAASGMARGIPKSAAVTSKKDGYPPRNYRTPRGVYKVILLGEVGQLPIQKILKSGRSVTIFSVGTGGMYNNRRPFEGESPEEYADRSYTQWHRVAVYQDRVAGLVMQHVKIGSQVYLEGNIETRVYNDPNSGLVKRIRELAIRANGRLMFMETPIATPAAKPAG